MTITKRVKYTVELDASEFGLIKTAVKEAKYTTDG